ncbi:MAG: S-methyl-5-thioribose-1-phosphate isomerase [Myxococcales bacterium]
MTANDEILAPLEWRGDAATGALWLLDQRRLPAETRWFECRTPEGVAQAIRDMAVRGAPAIGLAAGYGLVLAARGEGQGASERIAAAGRLLRSTRPTAVNLAWALGRLSAAARLSPSPEALLALATALHREDIAGNRRIAELGAARIEPGMAVLTHCNAGAIATGGIGTALGVLALAQRQGKRIHVFVDETRPRLQGARLTAWELGRRGVPHTLICDGAAAALMAQGRIQLVVTGADRIAANGDTANKIGTYAVAVAAAHHGIPFHVAAPSSTFDPELADGRGIPIEERDEAEVAVWGGVRVCPPQTHAFNPAFDVTPAALIRSIFTERGEIAPVDRGAIARVLAAEPR